VPSVWDELLDLANAYAPQHQSVSAGWRKECWIIGGDADDALVRTYAGLLVPGNVEHVAEQLIENAGVDLGELLADAPGKAAKITRSDCAELAAAASHLAGDGWPIRTLHLPNIPKASRRRSDSGIDVMAAILDPAAEAGTQLGPNEAVLLSTVKSRQSAGKAAVAAAVRSLDEFGDRVYLAQQLRVLTSVLDERGIPGDVTRAYWVLSQADRARPHAVAVTDAAVHPSVDTALRDLSDADGQTVIRGILIEDFESLADRCP
jgi:hypothetical protein